MRMLAFLLLLQATAAAAAPPSGDAIPLAAGVYWIEGRFVPGRQPDGNSVLFGGAGGWVVVDSGRHPVHAERILATVAASGRPLAAVVNTHWHLDHVAGNPRLRAAHPELVVHGSDAIDAALAGFLARYRSQLQALLADPARGSPEERSAWAAEVQRIDDGAALRPDRVVRGASRLEVGPDHALTLGVAHHAATARDVWVFDPRSSVLAAGDLVTLPAPFLDTACAPRWLDALEQLEAVPFTRLVPGHGAPMDRAGLARYRRGFAGLLACAGSDAVASACADGWIQAMGDLLPAPEQPQARRLLDYYLAERLRGAGAGADCPA